ncbi:MAG: NAD-dependent deacylase [Bacteroidetes bacterium]|nr:NAD-dependent deacylase [Bacteroidota bacterium]
MTISQTLRTLLSTVRSVCVLTGAGISAESGVATFRGDGGIWNKLRPEELANFDAFMRNPQLVWEWYSYRRTILQDVRPNPGHTAFVRMEQLIPDFTLVTQNVDNLHRRAGSSRVLELHGNIERSYCVSCGTFANDVHVSDEVQVPRCAACGGLIRPDVVWFGEMLPQDELDEAHEAAGRCELCLSVGTSGVVYPAAGIPIHARQAGAYLVEVNTEETDLSRHANELLRGASGTILPELVRIMEESRGMNA